MNKMFLISACVITLSVSAPPLLAQHSGSSGIYSPLSEPGDPIPEFNVGELHLQVDGWDIIPIYSIVEVPDAQLHEPRVKVRVRGIFFATDSVATRGEDLRAVWYQRPQDPAQDQWTASSWPTGSVSVAEAAFSVKTTLKIPDIQDQLWAIDDLEFITLEKPIPFATQIIAGDPKALPIDAPEEGEPPNEEAYPLGGIPIEAGDVEKVQANLEHLAKTFETVITTRSWDSVGKCVVWPHHPEQGLIPNRSGR